MSVLLLVRAQVQVLAGAVSSHLADRDLTAGSGHSETSLHFLRYLNIFSLHLTTLLPDETE